MNERASWFTSFRQRRPAFIASLIVLGVVAMAAAAPIITPYPPNEQTLRNALATPSFAHLLGTDPLGRDILSRLMFGFRGAIVGVVAADAVFLGIGVPAGLAAGYFGGFVDRALSSVVEVVQSMPAIIIMLVVIGSLPGNEILPMVVLGILASTSVMRIVRAATLAVRGELFVDAARVSGLAQPAIVFRHVLPRVMGPVLVQATLFAGFALLIQTGLGFLGFGPPQPNASLGEMVRNASNLMSTEPWLLIPAGLSLTMVIVSVGLIGDAIRDINEERWAGTPARPTKAAKGVVATDRAIGHEPNPDALLSVRDLSVAFPTRAGPQHVVQNVSFDVFRGETLGIVGESGCGKTISALAVLGLLPAGALVTSGAVWFDGTDLIALGPRRLGSIRGKRIAMVSQEPMAALDPVYSVANTLAEVVRRHEGTGRKETRARVLELLDLVGLPEPDQVARRYPHELSGGMAQRVAIAMALAGRPQLLIADEPTTALDVTIQAEILELLRTLRETTGLAIMFVTHDWGVVADICQRAVVMYAGQVVEAGPVAALVAEPRNPYTRGLLLSNPVNAAPRAPLTSITGTVPRPEDWPAGCRFAPRCPYAIDACRASPVELLEVVAGHTTRCIRSDLLKGESGVRSAGSAPVGGVLAGHVLEGVGLAPPAAGASGAG